MLKYESQRLPLYDPPIVLCPGHVTSQTDGQEHFIPSIQLAQLYGVDMNRCYIRPEGSGAWHIELPGALLLRPLYDGNYTKVDVSKHNKVKQPCAILETTEIEPSCTDNVMISNRDIFIASFITVLMIIAMIAVYNLLM